MCERKCFKAVTDKFINFIIAVFCCIFPAVFCVGCKDFEMLSKYDRAFKIARSDFGCKKILWVDSAVFGNNITGGIKYQPEEFGGGGFVTDEVLSQNGGYYVIGDDGDGNNIYVLVPRDKTRESAMFEWKFDYSFSEILDFIGQFGYKYADGIDGRENEYLADHRLWINDNDDVIMYKLKRFGNENELYARLDVKLFFEYRQIIGDGEFYDYYIWQEGGKLKLYQWANSSSEPNVFTYKLGG